MIEGVRIDAGQGDIVHMLKRNDMTIHPCPTGEITVWLDGRQVYIPAPSEGEQFYAALMDKERWALDKLERMIEMKMKSTTMDPARGAK